jgi:hypothetical protein
MKQTKFSVEIHANGELNESIIRMITNHNEGRVKIDMDIFPAFGKAKFAQWPTITKPFKFETNGDHTLDIWEGDTNTLTITEKELIPLSEVDQEILDELERTTN